MNENAISQTIRFHSHNQAVRVLPHTSLKLWGCSLPGCGFLPSLLVAQSHIHIQGRSFLESEVLLLMLGKLHLLLQELDLKKVTEGLGIPQ